MKLEYIVLTNNNLLDLMDGVNEWIKDGWKPQGGISDSIQSSPNNMYVYHWYAQAMIREVPEKEHGN